MNNFVLNNGRFNKIVVLRKDLIVFLICFLCFCVSFYFNNKAYYRLIPLLPLSYGFCYLFFLAPALNINYSMTGIIVAFCEFLRCVIMPLFFTLSEHSGFDVFSTTNQELLDQAIILMIYELFTLFLFFNLYNRFFLTKVLRISNAKFLPNRNAVIIIIIIAFIVYVLSPQIHNQINFLFLNPASEKVRARTVGEFGTINTGLINFVHVAFLCIFILLLDFCSRKFKMTTNKKYVRIAILGGFLTVSVIFGESRAGLIYTLFAVASCLVLKFPFYKKRIITVLLMSSVFLFIGMTIYRIFAVYNYISYDAAFASGRFIRDNYLSFFMEAYFAGPQTVAAGLEFSSIFSDSFTFERFFYDLFRPFMGFNFLLKDINFETTLTLYNSWLFNSANKSNGFFLQITNQCYCFFGFLLSPMFVCFFTALSMKLERWMKMTSNLFVFFFLNHVFIRTSTCMFAGSLSSIITTCSMTLLLTGSFFLFQKLSFNKTKNKYTI